MTHLRAPEPEDLDLMYTIENDPTLWQYGGQNQPVSRYTLRQYIEQCSTDIFRDEQLRLTIEVGKTPIGFLDLFNVSAIHQRAELGIVIAPPYQRRGLALEALQSVEAYVKDNLPLRLLYAVVAVTNTPSRKLFEKAGYKPLATLPRWIKAGQRFVDAEVWGQSLSPAL